MRRFLRSHLQNLWRDERGSQSIELILVLPILVWGLCAFYVFTQGFEARTRAIDATAVVADVLSRQTAPITQADLDGLQMVAGQLTGKGRETGLRVTQLFCERDCLDPARRILRVAFSQANGMTRLGDAAFARGPRRDEVPLMTTGDRIVLVHTRVQYTPPFKVGIPSAVIRNAQAIRMRFAPRLCWETCEAIPSA